MNEENLRNTGRMLLGAALIFAGVSHLTSGRKAFQAQVPDFVPFKKDDVVVYSGIVEIALGTALVATPKRYRQEVGKTAAAFFTAVFPGNISQFVNHKNAFGLDTDTKRFVRLFFQPALVWWALACTRKK
ncbi:hypothetical protein [Dyadobacter sp. CY312]|uniref:DoxX family protein n=1 Tax=Dyadobacter sp. CY312 TaxID=2907303 RepID=UPI001F40F0F6|nr:hypothetical protein [Dyadobacter sp. CY312]MCE7039012.1 hypothetical protein [Dyadobacter sp. CY312]